MRKIISLVLAIIMLLMCVACEDENNIGGQDAAGIINTMNNKLVEYIGLIGVLILAWGLISLVLSIQSESTDTKHKAILQIVLGIGAICMKTIFAGVL